MMSGRQTVTERSAGVTCTETDSGIHENGNAWEEAAVELVRKGVVLSALLRLLERDRKALIRLKGAAGKAAAGVLELVLRMLERAEADKAAVMEELACRGVSVSRSGPLPTDVYFSRMGPGELEQTRKLEAFHVEKEIDLQIAVYAEAELPVP
jgi:hypothetical protein